MVDRDRPESTLVLPPFGAAQVAVGFGVLLLSLIVASIVGSLVIGERATVIETAVGQTVFGLAMFGSAIVAARMGALSARTEGPADPAAAGGDLGATLRSLGFRRPRKNPVPDFLLAFFAYLALSLLLSGLLRPEQEDTTRLLGAGQGAVLSFVAATLVVVVASVSEETFFRGFAFAGLRNNVGLVVAAVLSSLPWAMLHLTTGNVAAAAQLFVFGLVLSVLYERTGSLWSPIALHALNNGLAFAILNFT